MLLGQHNEIAEILSILESISICINIKLLQSAEAEFVPSKMSNICIIHGEIAQILSHQYKYQYQQFSYTYQYG